MNKKTFVKDRIKVYLIAFLSIFFLMVGLFLIFSSLNIKSTKDVTVLTYDEKSNIDYNVYLKKNNYFKELFLGKDKQYIASVIDYIDVFFNYSFNSSKDVDVKFNYKVVANLVAKYRVDANSVKEVWSNEYVLLENKVKKLKESKSFEIKENVKINYQDYNNIINEFKKDHMLAVTSDLIVNLLVEVDGVYVPIEKVFKTNSKSTLTIPLSEQTINIKLDYKDINSSKLITSQKVKKFNSPLFLVIGIILSLISIILLSLQGIKIIKETKKQTKYIKELKKILYDYSDIIIEVNEPPVLPTKKVSEVISFSELVNAQVEVKSPIIFSEVIENEEGLFVVNSGDYCYYYRLKSDKRNK